MTTFEKLEALNDLIVGELSESFVSLRVFANETPFISFWYQPSPPVETPASAQNSFSATLLATTSSSPTIFSMKYLPLFYVIVCFDSKNIVCFKLITYHGKTIDELNGAKQDLSKEEMVNFVNRVSSLHLCQGVQIPKDVQTKLDLGMFCSLYVLEHLEENIILRSSRCSIALCLDDVICDACSGLSNMETHHEQQYESLVYRNEIDGSCGLFSSNQEMSPASLSIAEINDFQNRISNQEVGGMAIGDESDIGEEIEPKALIIYTDDTTIKDRVTAHLSTDIKKGSYSKEEVKINVKLGDIDKNDATTSSTRHVTRFKRHKKLQNKKPHKCPHCIHTTQKRQHLKDHIRAIHEKAKPFKCEHCTYAAATNSTVVKHMKIVHEKHLTVLCDRCDYKTSTNQNLLRHVSTVHEKVKPFQCEKCSHATTTQRDLDAHVMAKHDKLRPIQCDKCDYTTCRKSSLNSHIKQTHDPNFKPEMCDKCEFVANSRGNLLRHMRTVHEKIKPFECGHCEFATGTKQTLVNHVRIKHDKAPKSFMCQHCSHSTSSKGNLDIHIALSHSTVKPFKCRECNFETALQSHLKRHVQTVHEKIKPFQCPYEKCLYASNGNLQLQDHIRAIHEHVKGFFKCKWCPGDFNTRKARRRHVREIHPDVRVVKGEYNDL